MERNALLQADYLDILFDHRNKIYGGYELRKHYPQRVKKATLSVLIISGIICAYNVFAGENKPEHLVARIPPPITLTPPPVLPDAPKPPVLPPALPPPATHTATASLTPPKIIHDADAHPKELMASVDDLKNKQIGLENKTGDPTSTDLGVIKDGPPGTGTEEIIESTPPPSAPAKWVDQPPQFIGNMELYLNNHIHYPEQAREAGIQGRVIVQFVVDEQGDIADIHIAKGIGGGCDQEATRVVKGMPRWKPGRNNGVLTKVWFTLPITFTLN